MSFRCVYSCRVILLSTSERSFSSSLIKASPSSYFSFQKDGRRLGSSWFGISKHKFTEILPLKRKSCSTQDLLNSSKYLHKLGGGLLHERSVHRGRVRLAENPKPLPDDEKLRSNGIPRGAKDSDAKTSPDEKKDETTPPEKMTLFQKFKAMYRDYWYVLVPVHVVTSAMFYGSFYYMARVGVDVAALAEWAHFGEETVEKIRKSGNSLAGHLTIAYLLYKVMTPIRYTVTIGGTTISINYLKKWGLIKPVPKREELKQMYQDKKDELRRKRDTFRERRESFMKKSVLSRLPTKKRMKNTSDYVRRMLTRKRRKS